MKSTAFLMLRIVWIAVQLLLVTAMIERTATQFIYAGF